MPLVFAGLFRSMSKCNILLRIEESCTCLGLPPILAICRLLKAYLDSPWLNSVHVHVGSGGMGAHVLTAGIQVAVAFAKEVNSQTGRRQVLTLDIGGGLPVNYWGDDFGAEKVAYHHVVRIFFRVARSLEKGTYGDARSVALP